MGASGYAAIAAALANAASNVKGQSAQAPGFMPGTVQGLQPSTARGGGVVGRGGGDMDMNQLIRILSGQGGKRRF